jgi:integrase
MQAIEETCPLEDRVPERRVFQGISEASAYQAMTRACRNAKVPHYHPHDLRHRRITIWHQSGVPARETRRARRPRAAERLLSLLTDHNSEASPVHHQHSI